MTIILPIASFFAALLTIFGCILSMNVVLNRRRHRISLESGGIPEMQRVMRVFGNFIEYTPLFLFLLALAEVNGARDWVLVFLGVAFFIARIFHSIAISQTNFKFRFWSMFTTYTCLIALSFLLLLQFVFHLIESTSR